MGIARSLRVSAVVCVVTGWGALLWGLYLAPVSTNPELDLEAGAAFDVALTVYLPALGLTLLIAALLSVGILADRPGPPALAAAASVALAFGVWVSTRQDLSSYRPRLEAHLWLGTVTYAVALFLTLAAVLTRPSSQALSARATTRDGQVTSRPLE